jgi:hypothetical protein
MGLVGLCRYVSKAVESRLTFPKGRISSSTRFWGGISVFAMLVLESDSSASPDIVLNSSHFVRSNPASNSSEVTSVRILNALSGPFEELARRRHVSSPFS